MLFKIVTPNDIEQLQIDIQNQIKRGQMVHGSSVDASNLQKNLEPVSLAGRIS